MPSGRLVRGVMLVALMLFGAVAHAELVVGVVLSLSGPAAPVGQAQQRVVAHLPRQIGDQRIRYELRDDASDPDVARTAAIALVETASADVIIGSTTVAASSRLIDAMASRGVPVISPSAVELGRIEPGGPSRWAFRTAPDTWLMANAVVAHLSSHARARVAFVAMRGPYGDAWWDAFGMLAQTRRIHIEAYERFGTDPEAWSWSDAVAKTAPDAVMVVAAGSIAVESVRRLRAAGFAGPIYQTHAVALEAFRHACADACAGVMMPASPARLEEGEGPGRTFRTRLGPAATTFGAYVWDAGLLLADAIGRIDARPGSADFRSALRDGLESVRGVEGVNGVFSMGPRDHVGLDQRAVILVSPGENGWQTAL